MNLLFLLSYANRTIERGEEQLAKKVATAILICAVMVLVAGAPLALGGSHYVPKGDQGPRANAVTWEYVPASLGKWAGHITNDGLRSLVVDVYDNTTGMPDQISHQRIRFAAYGAYPTGVVVTQGVAMAPSHKYSITVTPSGPKGSSCTVDDVFGPPPPTVVAVITVVSMNYLTVVVDGSLSYCPDGTIASYDWDFGDGSIATGVTATHTYAMKGTYTITLTVTVIGGFTGTESKVFTVVEPPPIASFTVTASGLTVNVDASASTGYGALSYTWDWGDGTTGTGVTASHTYTTSTSTPAVSQALSGTVKGSVLHSIWGFTYDANGNPVNGCIVTVTNTRTGEFVVWDESRELWDPDINAYVVDMTEFWEYGWQFGDVLNVTATKGTLIGWTEAPITDSDSGFDQIDVILRGAVGYMTVMITLTVLDSIGRTASVSQTVTLNVSPVASFTYTVDGLTVNVNASSSSSENGIVSYVWDWGDGTTGTGVTATHTYNTTESVATGSELMSIGRADPSIPPTTVFGFTYAADGVTPMGGCDVAITEMATGEVVYTTSDPEWGVYFIDMSMFPSYFEYGDLLNVTATKGTQIGWNEAPITYNDVGYIQIDVVLRGLWNQVIILTVTDTIGQTDVMLQYINASDEPPTASFAYTVSVSTV